MSSVIVTRPDLPNAVFDLPHEERPMVLDW